MSRNRAQRLKLICTNTSLLPSAAAERRRGPERHSAEESSYEDAAASSQCSLSAKETNNFSHPIMQILYRWKHSVCVCVCVWGCIWFYIWGICLREAACTCAHNVLIQDSPWRLFIRCFLWLFPHRPPVDVINEYITFIQSIAFFWWILCF